MTYCMPSIEDERFLPSRSTNTLARLLVDSPSNVRDAIGIDRPQPQRQRKNQVEKASTVSLDDGGRGSRTGAHEEGLASVRGMGLELLRRSDGSDSTTANLATGKKATTSTGGASRIEDAADWFSSHV